MTESIMSNITKEQLQEAVDNAYNFTSALEYLGYIAPRANMYKIFKKNCEYFGIDFSRLQNEKKNPKSGKRYTKEEIFIENSTASQDTLRKHFIKEGEQEYKCSICGLTEWNNKPISLRLDHINGIRTDNRLENLRWVCPNCDSQLSTYCNKKYIDKNGQTIQRHSYCINCGKPITYGASRCEKCHKEFRKKSKPVSREELKNLIYNFSFVDISKMYKVSDNAVRKWCKSYNLPSRRKDISLYSEEEWQKI